MRSRLFKRLAGVSLLLFVVNAVLWVRSHYVAVRYLWGSPQPTHVIWSSSGNIGVDNSPVVVAAEQQWVKWITDYTLLFTIKWSGGISTTSYSSLEEAVSDAERIECERVDREAREKAEYEAKAAELGPAPTIPASVIHTIPHVVIAALTALLPVIALWRMELRRRSIRRQKAGLCLVCGYDCRANPERCSECGAMVSMQAPS